MSSWLLQNAEVQSMAQNSEWPQIKMHMAFDCPFLSGSPAEWDQPLEGNGGTPLFYLTHHATGREHGEGIDIFNTHRAPGPQPDASHTLSKIVIALIFQMRRQVK